MVSVSLLFTFQNGHIFVYTGILKIAQTKDQLAVVLGHEMAHALLNHAVSQFETKFMFTFLKEQKTSTLFLYRND